jgi:hypothetical protein
MAKGRPALAGLRARTEYPHRNKRIIPPQFNPNLAPTSRQDFYRWLAEQAFLLEELLFYGNILVEKERLPEDNKFDPVMVSAISEICKYLCAEPLETFNMSLKEELNQLLKRIED